MLALAKGRSPASGTRTCPAGWHEHPRRVWEKRGIGMQAIGEQRVNPELRELVAAASVALARLDADRLEELALACRALNRDLARDVRADFERQAREASREMAVFGRVLEATRSNLDVLNRSPERKRGGLEYPAGRKAAWAP